MQIEGYTIYSNNSATRGIVNYVRHDIICQQIHLDNSFNEYLLLQLQPQNKSKVLIGTIYRSPNSRSDNNSKLFGVIDNFSLFSNKYKLLLGVDMGVAEFKSARRWKKISLAAEQKFK